MQGVSYTPPQLPVVSHALSSQLQSVNSAPPQSAVNYSFGEPVNLYVQSAPPQFLTPGVSRSDVSHSIAQDHGTVAPPQLPCLYQYDNDLNPCDQPTTSQPLAHESGSHTIDNIAAVNQSVQIAAPQIQQSVPSMPQESLHCCDMNISQEDNISMQEEINDPGFEHLETMRKLATATLLPKSELMKFDGDPLKYFAFIKSFDNNVEKDICDSSRQLHLLIQYCTGKAKNVIESCI